MCERTIRQEGSRSAGGVSEKVRLHAGRVHLLGGGRGEVQHFLP